MRKLFVASILLCAVTACVQDSQTVSEKTMQKVFEEVSTPYKYGLVVTAPDDQRKTDCPTIFQKDGSWYMVYVMYDGRGYETWLAKSEDLLKWDTLGRVLSFSDEGDWDKDNKGGYIALPDTRWGGSYELEKYDGKYWMSYLGGAVPGYEQGHLSAGIAYTEGDPTVAADWKRLDHPVLSPDDPGASWWDCNIIYKNSIYRDVKKLTGHDFVMYYNAKGNAERIGMAVSDDMVNWERFGTDPVLNHGDHGITGDAYLQRMGKLWVMFYFGCGWNKETQGMAWDNFACSYDLVHWTDWTGEWLIEPSEDYDACYAHKPCMIKWKGTVYHFYCATARDGHRGIAVATSKDLGHSSLSF